MTDLSKEALDALVEDLWRGVKSCGLHDDMETELFLVDDANEVMASAADAMTALRQQIAAAEAAALERAAAWLETVLLTMPYRQELASDIRALITPEAASALAAREAAADRAGNLRGLLAAAEVKKEPKYGDDWMGMTCAIIALAERAEKGGAA